MRDKFVAAKALIDAGNYAAARSILIEIDHPKASQWLMKLDKLEAKQDTEKWTAFAPPMQPNYAMPQQMKRKHHTSIGNKMLIIMLSGAYWFIAFVAMLLIALPIFARMSAVGQIPTTWDEFGDLGFVANMASAPTDAMKTLESTQGYVDPVYKTIGEAILTNFSGSFPDAVMFLDTVTLVIYEAIALTIFGILYLVVLFFFYIFARRKQASTISNNAGYSTPNAIVANPKFSMSVLIGFYVFGFVVPCLTIIGLIFNIVCLAMAIQNQAEGTTSTYVKRFGLMLLIPVVTICFNMILFTLLQRL